MAIIEKGAVDKVLTLNREQKSMVARKKRTAKKLYEQFEMILQESDTMLKSEMLDMYKSQITSYQKLEAIVNDSFSLHSTAQKVAIATKKVKKNQTDNDDDYLELLIAKGGNNDAITEG